MNKRLGYLSAAPRVSTRMDAEASGPRAHVTGVIKAFEALGWNVHSYIVGDRLPRSLIFRSEEKMERSALVRVGADIIRLTLGIYHSIQAWRELKGKVDWVYERLATLQILGWIFQLHGVPWILETSGLFFYEAKIERKSIVLSEFARKIEIWAYRRCDVLICVTDALKELVVDVAKISPEKVLVVPNGVDTDRFDPEHQIPKRLFEGLTIGFVGALIKWHRLDVLLDALVEIRNEGVDYKLVVVGDGPMRNVWENQAKRLGFWDHVSFVGAVSGDKVPDYIAGFDLGYMGYSPLEIGKMYGSPLKLYEYMAMALPVVSTTCSDAIDMITVGENGYLFEPGDKEDLKKALHRAYLDRLRWNEIGGAAREKVVEKASWIARVRNMTLDIDKILTERHKSRSIKF